MNDWPKVRLEEICDVRDGTHASPKAARSGRLLVTSKNLLGGRLSLDNAYHVSFSDAAEIDKRSKVDQWDILISMIGTVGEVAIIKDRPTFVIKNVGLFKTHGDQGLANWIYYFLKSKYGKEEVQARLKGTSQQYISLGELRNFPIPIPPLATQRAITERLSAYDNLIENNTCRIAILEKKTEQLYKEWFVRYRFPGYERAKWIGGLPEGWMEGKAEDFFSITIGKTPPRKEFHWFTRNDANAANWLSIADMKGMFISYTDEQLTAEAIARFKMIVLPVDTILLSFKLTVGRVAIVDTPCATNEAIAHFRYTQKCLREYAYLYLKNFEYKRLGNTSAIGNAINSKIVKGMPFVMPTESLLALFHEKARKIIDLVKVLQKQNALLARERDLLLPRLMSGRMKP